MIEVKRKKRYKAKISMAPLIDCIFLLLIFFLLTSTFVQREMFGLELAAAQTAEVSFDEMVELVYTKTNDIFVNSRPVKKEELIAYLRALFVESENNDVMLIVDRRTKLEVLTALIDKVKQAGGSSLSIATRSEKNE